MNDTIQLLLADDDKDDCDLFRDALEELSFAARLSTVHDGEQLMTVLNRTTQQLPSVLFLDLNMPRKNGFECLSEIKKDENLRRLPVVIFSTSSDDDIVNLLYAKGAHFYISKPNEFDKLKRVIETALTEVMNHRATPPSREHFVLQY